MSEAWTKAYWDMVDDFYWSPKYLGFESIPKRLWVETEHSVAIPKEKTNPNGPLYRRSRSGPKYWDYVRRQEETFNHILNLVFAILPGDVVGQLFNAISGRNEVHTFASIGAEIRSRYYWKEHSNITTPDGFFVAENAVTALEIKFDSPTSLDQLAKYILLFVCEEQITGQRRQLDLIYIFNSDADATFERQIGQAPDKVDGTLFEQMCAATGSATITKFLSDNSDVSHGVLDRLRIRCIDWQGFAQLLLGYANKLGSSPGDRTLSNVLYGFVYEIEQHPLSNVARTLEDST